MAPWRLLGGVVYWLAWPALFVYLRIGARTRVLVVADEHVLLVQSWMGDGQWSLPGGGIHHGEQPTAGAIRETAEETGVVLAPSQLKLLGSEWHTDRGIKSYCHFFVAHLDGQVAARGQRGEIVDVWWVPMGELQSLPCKTSVDRALQLLAGNN